MNDTHAAHAGPSPMTIYIALVILTVVTVGVAYIPWSSTLGVVVAAAIASVKATLVGLYFMHLKFEVPSVYILIFVPLLLTMIMVLAVAPDVFARFLG